MPRRERVGGLEHFRSVLQRERQKRGLDRRAFARFLGVHENNLASWIDRGSEPGATKTIQIAKRLDLSLDYLLTGEDHFAGRDPQVVELARLLTLLEDDTDFLAPLETMLRERISRRQSTAGSNHVAEEDQAQSPPRGL